MIKEKIKVNESFKRATGETKQFLLVLMLIPTSLFCVELFRRENHIKKIVMSKAL